MGYTKRECDQEIPQSHTTEQHRAMKDRVSEEH